MVECEKGVWEVNQPSQVRSELRQDLESFILSKLSGSEGRSEAVVGPDVRRHPELVQQEATHLVSPGLG